MERIKIVDTLFAHAKYSTDIQESKYIIWDRTPVIGNEPVVFYTDTSLLNVNINIKKRYAWFLESTAVTGNFYQMIKHNNVLFDKVFTYDKDLLDLGQNFLFSPTAGCWIHSENQKVHNKSKLISCIMSNKNWSEGHKLRHVVKDNIKEVDYYGRGINPIDNKITALKDYMFSIVIENNKKDYYFTEKLIDCFRTGTIPIYWGCPSIGKFFDSKGILQFNNIEELLDIIKNINEDFYKEKLEYINKNFNIAEDYLMSEDYIYKNYFMFR